VRLARRRPPFGAVAIESDDELFDRTLAPSFQNLRMLVTRERGENFFAAGIPWFVCLFGRDSIVTALQTLAYNRRSPPRRCSCSPSTRAATTTSGATSALAWIDGPADHDGDGFVDYESKSAKGLANQGWKDSGNAIANEDGRAENSVALKEFGGAGPLGSGEG
jgi:glycogen debranching enzyme